MRHEWLVVALLVCVNCSTSTQCKKGTLLMRIALEGEAVQADQLRVAVSIDNGNPITTALKHSAGIAGGSIEIDFPSGYPSGKKLAVAVAASSAGNVVAESTAVTMLTAECTTMSLSIVPSNHTDDMATADLANQVSRDLGVIVDLATATLDMTTPESTATLDMTMPDDLRTSPDLRMSPDLSLPCGGNSEACCMPGNVCRSPSFCSSSNPTVAGTCTHS